MSPGGTMTRVYAALKARVLAGDFSPGERLNPARLSGELHASVTPIRDALHRLTGERLVDSWEQEGFHQPLVSEAGVRDLYAWSGELIALVLRAAERSTLQAVSWSPSGERADDIAALFTAIAMQSDNHEHRAAVASANDRCHLARLVEVRLFAETGDELTELAEALEHREWRAARRALTLFHRNALRRVPDIVANLRPRDRR